MASFRRARRSARSPIWRPVGSAAYESRSLKPRLASLSDFNGRALRRGFHRRTALALCSKHNLRSSPGPSAPAGCAGRARFYGDLDGWRLASVLAVVAITSLIVLSHMQPRSQRPIAVTVPNPSLTPGATVLVSQREICSETNAKNKAVPVALQRRVFDEYGIRSAEPRAYEVDYLITPALGGADDIHNLWPESSSATVWNAAGERRSGRPSAQFGLPGRSGSCHCSARTCHQLDRCVQEVLSHRPAGVRPSQLGVKHLAANRAITKPSGPIVLKGRALRTGRSLLDSQNMSGPSKENALRPDIGGHIPPKHEDVAPPQWA